MTAANADNTQKTVSELKAKFVNMRELGVKVIEKSGNTLIPVIYFGNPKIHKNFTVINEIKKTSSAYPTVSLDMVASLFG